MRRLAVYASASTANRRRRAVRHPRGSAPILATPAAVGPVCRRCLDWRLGEPPTSVSASQDPSAPRTGDPAPARIDDPPSSGPTSATISPDGHADRTTIAPGALQASAQPARRRVRTAATGVDRPPAGRRVRRRGRLHRAGRAAHGAGQVGQQTVSRSPYVLAVYASLQPLVVLVQVERGPRRARLAQPLGDARSHDRPSPARIVARAPCGQSMPPAPLSSATRGSTRSLVGVPSRSAAGGRSPGRPAGRAAVLRR